jgi:hypothetical protein
MRLYTPYIEISGITDVWINRISHWQRMELPTDHAWKKIAGGPGFYPDPNTRSVLSYIKTPADFHNHINGILNKRHPVEDSDGFSPLMYRCWISGSTLNIVQRSFTVVNGCWRFEDE